MPTPMLSFAVRRLRCDAGVVVTASHNPSKYNGYKAYWADGAQVLAPHDKGIIDEVNKVTVAEIKFEGNPELIQIVGKEIDDIYLEKVHTLSIDPECIKRQKDLKIVYTPLHGTGATLIPASLKVWGFENVITVPEQMNPDGNFPTAPYPNPEVPQVFEIAVEMAKEVQM